MNIPYYEQWLGLWAMLPDQFANQFDMFRRTDLHLHLSAKQDIVGEEQSYREMIGDVAVINLTGKLMKHRASLGGGTSTVQARREIRASASDPEIAAIMLRIDSPGGTAAGTRELGADIAAAARQKRVEAYIEDMGASAAYWAASSASRITSNATAMNGGMGTYGVVHDLSGRAAKEGVKVYVVKAGEMKGAGVMGTEITSEQLADMQRIVDGLNEYFIEAVVAGRGLSSARVRELADGRVHLGEDAKKLGLIDAVGSFEQALSEMKSELRRSRKMTQASLTDHIAATDAALELETQQAPVQPPALPRSQSPIKAEDDGEKPDDEEDDEEEAKGPKKATGKGKPKAASYSEIVAGCPGADPSFICTQLGASATVLGAQQAWMAEQNSRIAAAKQSPGVDAVGTRRPGKAQPINSDAIEQWESLVQDQSDKGKSRAKATRYCVANYPEEHLAFLAAHNDRVDRD